MLSTTPATEEIDAFQTWRLQEFGVESNRDELPDNSGDEAKERYSGGKRGSV